MSVPVSVMFGVVCTPATTMGGVVCTPATTMGGVFLLFNFVSLGWGEGNLIPVLKTITQRISLMVFIYSSLLSN